MCKLMIRLGYPNINHTLAYAAYDARRLYFSWLILLVPLYITEKMVSQPNKKEGIKQQHGFSISRSYKSLAGLI